MKELMLTSNRIIVFVDILKKHKASPIYNVIDGFGISVLVNEEMLESVLYEFTRSLQYYRAIGTCALKRTN